MHDDRAARDHVDRSLIRRYQASRDPDLLERVVLRTRPLAHHLARSYAERGEPLSDLRQVAVLGLVQAVERFDPASGHRFASFATPTITGTLKRHFRDAAWRVHVPRPLQELSVRRREEAQRIQARTGRAATPAELATALGISREELGELEGLATAHAPVALDVDPDEAEVPTVALGGPDPGYARVEDGDALRDAADALDEREREILWMRYAEGRKQREIGEAIGVSQVQVSRLLSSAVERMQERVAAV